MPMMDNEDTMQGETGMDNSSDNGNTQSDEPVSVFLPKAAFGDKPPKVGDDLSDFKIVDIDSETGDVEAQCTYDNKDESENGSMSDEFDKAMPEES